jgi:hypothetical protein
MGEIPMARLESDWPLIKHQVGPYTGVHLKHVFFGRSYVVEVAGPFAYEYGGREDGLLCRMVCCVTDTTYTSDRMRDLAGINKESTFFAASVCTRLVFTPATGHVPLLTKPVALGICWLQLRLSEAEYMRYSNMLGSGSWEGASFEMMDIMKHSHVRRMDRFLEFTIRTFHDGRLMFYKDFVSQEKLTVSCGAPKATIFPARLELYQRTHRGCRLGGRRMWRPSVPMWILTARC